MGPIGPYRDLSRGLYRALYYIGPYLGPYLAAGAVTVQVQLRARSAMLNRTPSEFTQHLQDLPNTFRIYPTPSEFTQHLQNLPFPFWDPTN